MTDKPREIIDEMLPYLSGMLASTQSRNPKLADAAKMALEANFLVFMDRKNEALHEACRQAFDNYQKLSNLHGLH